MSGVNLIGKDHDAFSPRHFETKGLKNEQHAFLEPGARNH